jgi:hypothetical protein
LGSTRFARRLWRRGQFVETEGTFIP